MKEKVSLVIAVLMITSMAFAISTTSVSAAHTPTVSIDNDTVKASTSMVRTITVQNAGPAAIDNVLIITPSGWGFAPTIKAFKDNLVTLTPGNENVVTLPAGTVVYLAGATTVRIPENTLMIRLINENLWRERTDIPDNKKIVKLLENVNVQAKFADNTAIGLVAGDNIKLVLSNSVTLENGLVRLPADTTVVRVAGSVVKLPENTIVEPIADRNTASAALGLEAADNVTLENEVTLTLAENRVRLVTDNLDIEYLLAPYTGDTAILRIPSDENMQLASTDTVVVQAGTLVRLNAATQVTVYENTDVIRTVGENVTMEAATENAAENRPKNWLQAFGTSAVPPGLYVRWENNVIASGASLDFPFAITTPSAGGDYTIYVKTTDTTGLTVSKEITLTIDNIMPTVTVVASPSWIGENGEVTITLTANETLVKLENVMVAENNAPENTQITMTPNADNTVWTGTYTTGDNTQRDGTATIYVIGSQFEDLHGNAGSDNTGTFGVDRLKPPTPSVTQITGFPTDAATTLAPGIQTKQATWFIENIALDNFAGSLVAQEGMTVKIRIGTTVSDIITPASGYYNKSITLSEGTQEIGIQYVDKAGNVGMEDNENVTYDATKPSISITSPENGAILKDNTPTIKLTIADTVLGVENDPFDSGDNSGYTIQLCWDNGTPMPALTFKAYPAEDPLKSFTFENNHLTELAENFYRIRVVAGDNLQMENVYFRFEVDVTAPSAPSLDTTISTNIDNPRVIKTASRTVTGTAEAGAKIKVYFNGAEQTALETTADATTGDWSVIVAPTPGTTTKIEFRAIDKAGNEGSKVLYGYLLVDGTAPEVDITAPEDGISMDATSIIVEATVDKDTWETYAELTVRIDATSLTAPITATNVLSTDGKLTRAVELVEGSNTISVSAQDVAGNWSTVQTVQVTRTVTPWATYAIVIVIVALILAAIAIFRKR